ncbi:MAG: VOC family protein [Clostridiales Family XIII bacterium]|jgi:hypothetical protein|nr:VOC family protein [Clostridiales Family XIII bacterium]
MIDGITVGNIAIDCVTPEKLRDFYAELTGWEALTLWNCPALISSDKLTLLFMPCDFDYLPPVWPEEPGRQQKQMHFDFQAEDLPSAVREAITLGAAKPESQYGGNGFVTLLDPEGHPFCLCRKERGMK